MSLLPEDERRLRKEYPSFIPFDLDLSALPAGWAGPFERYLDDLRVYFLNKLHRVFISKIKLKGLLLIIDMKGAPSADKHLSFIYRVFRQRCVKTCIVCSDKAVAIDIIGGRGFCPECFELHQAGII